MNLPDLVSNNADLSLVNTIGDDCRVYRETSGRYVVQMNGDIPRRNVVATLACAYAICQEWQNKDGEKSRMVPSP
jgi:hypothetical protein